MDRHGSLQQFYRDRIDRARAVFRVGLGLSPDMFLREAGGVIHVGANVGQERDFYDVCGLDVIWVEPAPDTFEKLKANLRRYPRQRALRYLLTERDGEEVQFHVSSNNGESSSILELAQHRDLWPDVGYVASIPMTSTTLPAMLAREGIDVSRYRALVMDTQGAELRILKGAQSLLTNFRYIKVELPDFESYAGCCVLSDVSDYLAPFGFDELRRTKFAEREGVGSYYDVVYQQR